MEPRVLITGGGGQLARALQARLRSTWGGGGVWAPPRAELDITDQRAVQEAVAAHRPDWIVNCAAFTSVDGAEKDPAAAYRVNDDPLGWLAGAAASRGARLLHLSTDYVFDGLKGSPYTEDDRTHAVNVYGASKLAGEERLAAHGMRWTILRSAWLYGEDGSNFLTRIVEKGREAIAAGKELPVVTDQVGCPTDVHTLSLQIEAVLRSGLSGLYHAAAQGAASWYELAEAIFGGLGLAPRLAPIRGAELGRPAARPPRVVLLNRNLKAEGQDLMIPWKEGVRKVLELYESRRHA